MTGAGDGAPPTASADTAAGEVVLRLTDVVKTFPGVRALDGVQLEVRAGEVHCLPGQNGAGKSTRIGLEAMKAGIPVVNLDRALPDARAYRVQIKGDNYGMGVAAANYIVDQLKARGVSNPVIGEIPGFDSLEPTQERSKGFADTLAAFGFKVGNRRPAEFTADSGQQAATGLLQALPKIDAIWNHDDDQGIGVLAAVNQTGRREFLMEIVLASETITKENAGNYLKLGF